MKIEKLKPFFTSKKVWTRVIITFVILGWIAFLILADHSCTYNGFNCKSKSKINVEVKK